MANLIEVNNLKVSFRLDSGSHAIQAVDDISFRVAENEVLVLAGESGSGKTVTALALTRILPPAGRITSGSVRFQGQDLLALKEEALVKIRGRDIAYIFQEPASFLNPVFTIGSQIAEAIILHQDKTKEGARQEALELLRLVQIKEPARVFASYPHQLSGGMNQRVFTAMSLACRPKLLIADEPTTALDVTVESQIVRLLLDLKKTLGFSMLFITHNLALAKKIADRVCVMYKGKIVEEAGISALFAQPQHFHTKELIAAYEKIGEAMILEVKNVSKVFKVERGFFAQKAQTVRALDAVSFQLEQFRTLGIVGESGSGKTTLAKIILRLVSPTEGTVTFDPARITDFRKDVQIIFQNPYNSLNSKMRIVDIIAEPLIIHKLAPRKMRKERAAGLLTMVGLDPAAMDRYPAEFSGGQRQRICIARALATQPKCIVLDEPISSLDLTIQAQMLELFMRLKEECKLTYIFISHNLAVVKHIADSVIVMRDGRIVEEADTQAIFAAPKNDYTRLLLEAARG